MATTIASSMDDVVSWVVANEHHEGYWTHLNGPSPTEISELVLVGNDKELRIPISVHVPGALVPSDFERTRRMFEPAP